jgi:hypothetical protein
LQENTGSNLGQENRQKMPIFGRPRFELTESGDIEEGVEKIALYVREGEVQHTARQLAITKDDNDLPFIHL